MNNMKTIFTTLDGVMIDVSNIVVIGKLYSTVCSNTSIFPYHETSWGVPVTFLGTSSVERVTLTNDANVKLTDDDKIVQQKRDAFKKIAEEEYNRLVTMWKAS